jgi:hypothetical protein
MSETFALILKLSDERQNLYFLAGKQHLTPGEHNRLDELNGRLPVLWDAYRREIAGSNRVIPFERPLERETEREADRKAA